MWLEIQKLKQLLVDKTLNHEIIWDIHKDVCTNITAKFQNIKFRIFSNIHGKHFYINNIEVDNFNYSPIYKAIMTQESQILKQINEKFEKIQKIKNVEFTKRMQKLTNSNDENLKKNLINFLIKNTIINFIPWKVSYYFGTKKHEFYDYEYENITVRLSLGYSEFIVFFTESEIIISDDHQRQHPKFLKPPMIIKFDEYPQLLQLKKLIKNYIKFEEVKAKNDLINNAIKILSDDHPQKTDNRQ